jgi:endonuclease-8
MPEGNEVHRFAEVQSRAFTGKKIKVDAPNGRFQDGAAMLDGRKLRAILVTGKHLGYDFGRDLKLHVHLGMYGDFTQGKMPYPAMRGALRLRFSTRNDWLELRGPTDCSVFSDAQWQALLARLGPDPLNANADPTAAFKKIAAAKAPIGALLMDQSVIAGIGNIYRGELLFRARLNPLTPGREVPTRVLRAIWKDAVTLMPHGMVDRRIVTTRPKDRPHKRGEVLEGEQHYVYRRHGKPCFVCGTDIKRTPMAGRTLYWCPVCQAAPNGARNHNS